MSLDSKTPHGAIIGTLKNNKEVQASPELQAYLDDIELEVNNQDAIIASLEARIEALEP